MNLENVKSYYVNSSILDEDYEVKILFPTDYDSALAYETIYLLDGDWYFEEMANVITNQYPDDIVLIGIGYKNENRRNSDFTYPYDDYLPNSGNAKAFLNFINTELIQFIDDSLKIKTNQRTLAGHSLAGYFSLFMLFQNESAHPFNNIISASPSLWWHDAYIIELEDKFNNQNDTLNVNLYITMGDSEGVSMNALFNALSKKIKSRNYNELEFHYERFENTTHNNNPIKSIEKGIENLLN